jgi:hypothetical protein
MKLYLSKENADLGYFRTVCQGEYTGRSKLEKTELNKSEMSWVRHIESIDFTVNFLHIVFATPVPNSFQDAGVVKV